MKKTFTILTIAALLMACASKKSTTLTQVQADKAAAKFPGATLATLNEGKSLYETHCDACHALKKTGNYSEAEWRKLVPPMSDKAKIDKTKEDLILQYVVTMAAP